MEEDNDNKTKSYEKKNIYIPNNLRVFISYSEENKKIASGIKENLNRFGVQAFLAHDDIPPGKEWISEILKNIKNADIFIALLSKDFQKSKWTDQETGIAVCLDKFIIPISIDGTIPYGFMDKYQAFKDFNLECRDEIFKIISEEVEFKENLADSLITSLENVSSFRTAESHFEILYKLEPFSEGQINTIIENSIKNKQVHKAHGCQRMIGDLLKKYSHLINKEKIKEIEGRLSE